MSAKILLIDPPLYKHPFWDPIRYSQPLGLISLASQLKHVGHEVGLLSIPGEGWDNQVLVQKTGGEGISFHGQPSRKAKSLSGWGSKYTLRAYQEKWAGQYLYVGLPLPEILQRVCDFSPDLIGISLIASCNHRSVIDLVLALREAGCEIPIVVGGQHVTAQPELVLRDAQGSINWAVCGEADQVIVSIAANLADARVIERLPGVACVGADGQFVHNKRSAFFDLNEIALLDAQFYNAISLPATPSHSFSSQGRRYADVMFSVGCHNNCAYCFSPQMRGRFRRLNDKNVRLFLQDLWDKGFRELILQDDDLLCDRPWFERLIWLINDFGFKWQDNGGIELELLDKKLVDMIASSGCTGLYVPVNPRKIGDRLPHSGALVKIHALRALREQGVYTFTSGIYGVPNLQHPEKTLDDVRSLRDFHLELVGQRYVDASLVFSLSALPGTKWYSQLAKEQNFLFDREDWSAYSTYVPQLFPGKGGPQELEEEILEVHRLLNEKQVSYPWFSPFPNNVVAGLEEEAV